ncbi:uncharacterized protein LOC118766890 [Octopus sinensis]|uniref:Uncharacterized protein LOC118766890 n=1 Tax=Octopus sinensis TaxID=2607531 RepID=A0A7E6FGF0_9MOLL|nr:uncharacterized protein LOC118766890 [Octopus sinensis]
MEDSERTDGDDSEENLRTDGDSPEDNLITNRDSPEDMGTDGDSPEDNLITNRDSPEDMGTDGDSPEDNLITNRDSPEDMGTDGDSPEDMGTDGDGPEDNLITNRDSPEDMGTNGDGPEDNLITNRDSPEDRGTDGDGPEDILVTDGDNPEDNLITDGDRPDNNLRANEDSMRVNLYNAPSMNNLQRAANIVWARPSPLLVSNNLGNEESIEMTTRRGSRQPQQYDRQRPQRLPTNYYKLHWLYLLVCLTLCVFSFSCSTIHLLKIAYNFPKTVIEYMSAFLDLVIDGSALIIFCIIFPFSKRGAILRNRRLIQCLVCTLFKIMSATVSFGLQQDWIVLAVLVNSITLLTLLCLLGLRMNFPSLQNR